MIAGVVKAYNLPPDYVLYELSYTNMVMYSAVLPSYNKKDKKTEKQKTIEADDPQNRQAVRKFLENVD